MNKKITFLAGLITVCLFLISSCATTSLMTVWKDDQYQGKVQKVLVIGISKRDTVKRAFESEFVRQLKARGIDAVPSFRVLPSDKKLEKEQIDKKAKELNADAILLTRMVDQKTVKTYYPGETYVYPRGGPYGGRYRGPDYHRHYYGYYGRGYSYVTTPGYEIENQVVYLETNLYDIKTENLVWSALSETFVEGAGQDVIRSFIGTIIKNMSGHGLV